MLRMLLTWHLTATAVLLAVYVLVSALQWSAARVRGALTGAAGQGHVAVPEGQVSRGEGDLAPAAPAMGSAA